MTPQIAVVLTILFVAVVLFITERLRVDAVALLVMSSLALTGLVTPSEALSGFSNPAVVTVGAVLILSGGLSRTGVANIIGRQVLRLAGKSQMRLLVVIMLTTGVMSAFMNNIGAAALMLPVVINIARRMGHSPSKLLMPLAFGSLLGGLNTLIGTPPNILVSESLGQYGLRPFQMFDYSAVGIPMTLAGVAFIALIGRHLLPERDISREFRGQDITDLGEVFDLQERLFVLRLPSESTLVGKTLAESRLGSALGLNVIGVRRNGQMRMAPESGLTLQAGDRMLVAGRLDRLNQLHGRRHLIPEEDNLTAEKLVSAEVDIVEVALSSQSSLLGQTLQQIDFRRRYGGIVLAIWRAGVPLRTDIDNLPLQPSDILLMQGLRAELERLQDNPKFQVSSAEPKKVSLIDERLMVVRIPDDSTLVGKTLVKSRIAETFGLTVLGLLRDGTTRLMPPTEERFQAGDMLLVKGKSEHLATIGGLQGLEIDREVPLDLEELESEGVGLLEAVLSPHTTLAGKTLRQLHFREKHGLSLLAIWREGRPYRSNLRDMALRFGDAFLLYGSREKLKLLGSEPDFLVLSEETQEAPHLNKAPLAVSIMAGVLLSVILGWVHISIAAVVGATLMVVTGCLNMEEAYRFIEWRAIFLIAGMLPLGIAMDQTGAASLVAEGVVATVGGFGPLVVVASLFILAILSTQVLPNPAVAVLLAPIAVSTANDLGMSPHTLMMTLALAASAAFLSPVGHPVNVLVMGPGGYRFIDYIKMGLPLSLVVLVVLLFVLPVFWPLFP